MHSFKEGLGNVEMCMSKCVCVCVCVKCKKHVIRTQERMSERVV